MELPKRLRNDLNKHRKRQIRIDARIDRESERQCDDYRCWFDEQVKAKRGTPITIMAEGDSWFKYVVGRAIISQLERLLNTRILNLASPGDETKDMLSIRQKRRLARELKRGPARRKKYDYLLFSGGGNDLVGIDRFHKWLKPYQTGMTAKQVINRPALKVALDMIELNLHELLEIRDQNSPKTTVIMHAYDFAIPDGRGVCGRGPWMKPGLEFRGVPVRLRKEVVKLFLLEYDKLLKNFAKNNQRVRIVQTQGTLVESEWANELHPRNVGFRKIAKLFLPEFTH
ncbi:MAG: hypothetical protein AAF431_13445 [Pseudomonadota bacterium]